MLERIEDPYLLFLESLRSYTTSTSPVDAWSHADRALQLCIRQGKFETARNFVNALYRDYRADSLVVHKLLLRLVDLNLQYNNGEEAEAYITRLPEYLRTEDATKFRLSHSYVLMNRPREALTTLLSIQSDVYPKTTEFAQIRQVLEGSAASSHRSAVAAMAMSALVPGSGQIYSGHLFDGANAFMFCGILGSASYMGWKYQEGRSGWQVIPIITSIAFLYYYVSNIWNAGESAERYNNYQDSMLFKRMISDYVAIEKKIIDRQ
ncbi:MAG: hypothetical protein Q8P51_18455 [Ignavibacteria bacterium]|nr:hypothetical protein [Ignavibacteria bacterium]